ncbi:Asp-tRNA(Asn)/Glu-tRNA(Gln) amidotransferase subunit GatA [Leptospira sp. GIMC2001]|uniref:Asp-tRNA(Asn)/Glu-tRNA(Gln) amidotransferase subunit GatA n=1 Tax=Leptospira sp. GIMC2001 TaxID=1513297 RepID=UPI00234BEA88|nr:Asp-tRNA(Asn)/Glu-tRNA(Gln) amidotransferase subunit GatA [Leptospira sp. GIMC2001]WCL48009.1 Asp-tRNA(Asn)/Glu-tRNA(Gln) amidotransferase subunit GatA [Leptospira sp. GIMC2001]
MIDVVGLKFANIRNGLNENKFTSEELVTAYINRIETFEPKIGSILEFNKEYILSQAKASDERRKAKKELSKWDGIPIGIKNNICIKDVRTTCASKILENFISPYDATAIEKLKSKGFVLIPGLNMDEFAMGSSTENSAYKITKNPFDTSRIPGGSSGGSAAGVAASFFPVALGSDTGGSIRQPAALCGVVGLKPTYGRVSRYGLVAYASSLDQIGPISNDVEGASDVLEVISGLDSRDSTSSSEPHSEFSSDPLNLSGLKIGIMMDEGSSWEPDIKNKFHQIIEILKKQGSIVKELDFSLFANSIPIYYIIATAECSSNLSRFDGIKFGHRAKDVSKLEDLYVESRSQGFGAEVKRRILLGTFSLSSGYYDAYYGKAQKSRILIQKKYDEFFESVDVILQPTSPTTAFKIGEKTKDPVQMYKADILTTSVNLAGLPGISIPAGLDAKGLPIGLQITGKKFAENQILALAKSLSSIKEMEIALPKEIN